MSDETQGEELSRLGVDLPRALHVRLKMLCVGRRERIQDFVHRAVEAEVERLELAAARASLRAGRPAP